MHTYIRLLRYALRYKWRLGAGLFFSMVFGGSITGMLLALEQLLQRVFDDTEAGGLSLWLLALSFPLIGLVRGLGHYFSVVCISSVGYRVVTDLRDACFSHLQRLSLAFFSRQKAGDLISRISNDSTIVQQAVSSTLGDLVRAPFALLGCVAVLIWKLPQLSFIVFLVIPVCALPVVLLGRKVKRYSKQNQEKLAGLVSVLQENISGSKVVRAFGTEALEEAKFQTESRAVYRRLMRILKHRSMSQPLMEVVTMFGLATAFLLVKQLGLAFSEFIVFVGAVVMMYDPIKKLSRSHMTLQNSNAAAERIFELLDTPIKVKSRPDARMLTGTVGEIRFDHASFDYGEGPLLRDINLTVRRGECVAFVGPSGHGKSTLVSLLPRFFDVLDGAVRFDGVDIRDLDLRSLREQIGLVTQDTFLFHDTIAANIAYGADPDDRAGIEAAARRAHAADFVAAMPEGYDTVIGDQGVRLSGGQRQRLAIARALYRNAPILILDEATSALDTEAERQVQSAIDELMEGRTVFAIAHRLSTIRHADRIIFLREGRIVEEGKHAELLDKGGDYRELYDMQFADQAASG